MTNQPTDATLFCDCGDAITTENPAECCNCTERLRSTVESLTAQLAAKQAEAKALESWGEQQHHALYALNEGVECYCVDTSKICRGCEDTINALSTPKPQPVDASSLARIARCAQFPDALFYQNLNNPQAARRLVNHWLDNYNALTPNDIALAQALAGGA